jgi:ABC-2 type transport system permease protein
MTVQLSTGYPSNSFWFYLLKLIRLRWLISITGFKRAKPLRKLLYIVFGILILVALVGTYLLTSYILGLVKSPEVIESGINLDALIKTIPPLIISGAFLGILMFSFGVLLQALYLANDMDFLLSSPIPIRAIFLTKLMQAILPNLILVMIFGLPVLFSLGASNGYNILYFILTFVVLVFLSLAAAGIASILVMVTVHFLPAKRVAEILALIAAIFFMVLSQLGNLTGVSSDSLTYEQVVKSAQALSNFNNVWSPLTWGGWSLVELGEGHWVSGIAFLSLALGLAGGLFWLALNAAEHLYYSGWASLRASVQPRNNHHTVNKFKRKSAFTGFFRRILSSQVWGILSKDFISLRRDLRNTSRMVMPLIMGIVFMVMMLRSNTHPSTGIGDTPELLVNLLQSAQVYRSMLVPLFVGSLLILNLALIAFSIEGRSYWILKTSPVNANKQLIAKFLIAFLASLAISWIFLLISLFLNSVPSPIVLYDLFASAFILAGLTGIVLSIGVRGANLYWDDPRHITTTLTDITGIAVTIAYLLGVSLLFLAPTIGLSFLGISEGIGWLAGLSIGGIGTSLCAILPLVQVKQRVYRIGEAA